MPDFFDKAIGLMSNFDNRSGAKTPFEFILEQTNVIEPRDYQANDIEGLMEMFKGQSRPKSPLEMMFGGK